MAVFSASNDRLYFYIDFKRRESLVNNLKSDIQKNKIKAKNYHKYKEFLYPIPVPDHVNDHKNILQTLTCFWNVLTH